MWTPPMTNDLDPRMLAAAAARAERQRLVECFDSNDLMSRPSEKQWEIMRDIEKIRVRFLIAGNQTGKSSAAIREMAWILNETHPFWKRPDRWGKGPLFMIVAGQNRQNIEEELWKRKLKPLLFDKEDWKEKKSASVVIGAVNEKNGNTIIFLVHGQGSEETRAALQGYRAHYILFDEMPKEFSTFTEIQMRANAYGGYIFVAFTPLLRNLSLKNAVENAQPPYAKKYIWTVWDNPCNCTPEKRKEIEQQSSMWGEAERRTRLYGEWSSDDNAVYHFNIESMVVDIPSHYSKTGWRHVEAVDPAGTGVTGLTVWAEDPLTGLWYGVLAEYIKGDVSKSPVRTVQEVYEKTLPFNMVRHVSDTMQWYYSTAREVLGRIYLQPYNKTQRKDELIKNLQEALTSGKLKLTRECQLLIEEFLTCRWNEAGDKIVGHQHFHLLDCAQYFWDLRPKADRVPTLLSRDQQIMVAHEKAVKQRAVAAKAKEAKKQTKMRIRMRSRIFR